MSELWAVHREARPDRAVGVLEVRMAQPILTFRERRALRRSRFDPDAFDLDQSDRVTIIFVIVLTLFVGGLWLLGR